MGDAGLEVHPFRDLMQKHTGCERAKDSDHNCEGQRRIPISEREI